MSEAVLAEAEAFLAAWDAERYDAYLASGVLLDAGADQEAASGPEWLVQPVSLVEGDEGTYTLSASHLKTPLTEPAPFGGVVYCKVWSFESAVQFMLAAAAGASP